ncbi:MAG: cardiolipin synthase [Planctomycetota bacterium]|jgi:cardiolipin synthase
MPESLLPVAAVIAEYAARVAVAAIILLRSRGTPAVRLAWLVIVFAIPVVGVVAYLLVGEVRFGRRRGRRHRRIAERIGVRSAGQIARPEPFDELIPREHRQIAYLAESVGGNMPHGGHALRLFGDTDLFIQALVEDIAQAQAHCHLEFYIFLDDHSGRRVAEALMEAAGRSVACRLLVDGVGSNAFLKSDLRKRMAARGVTVVEALPASLVRMAFARIDLRNHRKLAVIDGAVGYCGSQNIADAEFAPKPRYAPWVDTMVRLQGPAVHDLQVLFIQDWYLDTNEALEAVLAISPAPLPDGAVVQIMGTGPDAYNEALRQIIQTSLHAAREELILTTPYFVPDEATASALYTSARRGVETTLVVPARNDSPLVAAASRSYYEALLDAGVRIHEYQHGLLHAKTLTLDRRLALVTTANFDRRSFELNFEVSLVVYDSDFASELRLLQKAYSDGSVPVNEAAWRRRGWPRRLWQNTAGMLGPIL